TEARPDRPRRGSGRCRVQRNPPAARQEELAHVAEKWIPVFRKRTCASRLTRPLSDRRSVLQSTIEPERVLAAGDLEQRRLPEIAFEGLAVVAGRLDGAVGPILVEPQCFAIRAFLAEEAAHIRIRRRLALLVDVRLRDL